MEDEFSVLTFHDDTKFWIVRAEGGKYFDDFIDDNYIGIRYNKVTIKDLESIQTRNEIPSVDTVKDIYKEIYGNGITLDKTRKQKLTEHAKQTYLFTFEMKIGDVILVPNKRSRKFALGIVTSNPYDEEETYIQNRIDNHTSNGLNFKPSNYVKRRKINFISIVNRNEIPNELSWILSTHQAIINATSAKKKLMPLIFPLFKYQGNYYLRIFSNKGGNLSMKDWAMIVSPDNKINTESITMEAEIHSPGFLTFITPYLPLLHQLLKDLGFGIPIAGTIQYIFKLLVGKNNLKEKGLVQWAQDVYGKHLDNKIKNLNYIEKKQNIKIKTTSKNNNQTVAQNLKLSIPISGTGILNEEDKKKKLNHNEKE